MVAILGSGFGIYGYLPAIIVGCGRRVVLPERYRERLASRNDVGRFIDKVEWARNEEQALDCANAVVVAQRPSDQVRWVDSCLKRPNIEFLVLEKPLAPSPTLAGELMNRIESSGKILRMGYTFRYTDWGRSLVNAFQAESMGPISIDWRFQAHHYAHNLSNWKRFEAMGGGALRFYGIQLIALLAEIGYRDVLSSEIASADIGEAEEWRAVLNGNGLPECAISIATNSPEKRFTVRSASRNVATILSDPFETSRPLKSLDGLDIRTVILADICRDLFESNEACYAWYRASVNLWAKIEQQTDRLVNREK